MIKSERNFPSFYKLEEISSLLNSNHNLTVWAVIEPWGVTINMIYLSLMNIPNVYFSALVSFSLNSIHTNVFSFVKRKYFGNIKYLSLRLRSVHWKNVWSSIQQVVNCLLSFLLQKHRSCKKTNLWVDSSRE